MKKSRSRRRRLPRRVTSCCLAATSLSLASHSQADLIHRWSFNNAAGSATGATVEDGIGGAHGTVHGNGATFTGSAVRLTGGASGTAPYVDLPNNLVSVHEAITIEAWLTVHAASGNWVRFFDFGAGEAGEVGGPGGGFAGTNYLFLSAATGGDYNTQQLEIRVAAGDGNNTLWRPDRPAAFGQQIYFVITVDSAGGQSVVNYWRNDEHILSDVTSPFLLSEINDVNNWLGRSNWSQDANMNGEFNEFRIYDHAFSPEEVFASRASGPDNLVVDTDNDGMPDGWETQNGLIVGVNDSGGDPDGDGLPNVQEFQRGTNPQNPDTDGDGLSDSVETNTGIWVSAGDTGTDPLHPDTDRDGLPDNVETKTGVFVGAGDTGTDPHLRDTDGDGSGDATEVAFGTNPLLPASVPAPRLVHRYSFTETIGNKVADAAGGAHGFVHGADFVRDDGQIELPGGSSNVAPYVALPSGLVSNHGKAKGGRGAVTLEGWATVLSTSGGNWARLVDIGTSDPGGANGAIHGFGNWNGGGTNAQDTFFLTAYNGTNAGVRQLSLRNGDGVAFPMAQLNPDPPVTSTLEEPLHFVITFDESSGRLAYYENGVFVNEATTDALNPIQLGNIKDSNVWLGRSNFTHDGNLHGRFDEFRVYEGALPEEIIAQHFNDGPEAAPAPGVAPLDSDGDGMPDWFERAYGLDPAVATDAGADADGDGVTNLQEFQRGSSPLAADTDRDGLSDAVETNTGVYVSATDTGSHPAAYDTDGDFVSDGAEVLAGSNPVSPGADVPRLLHRWSFDDPAGAAPDATPSTDAVSGEPNAIIRGDGASFTGEGVTLPGGSSASAAYVDLPNQLISPLKAVTIEGWASIHSNSNAWARIFDFGNTRVAPDSPDGKEITGPGDSGQGGDYLFLSAAVGTDYNVNRLELREVTPGPEINGVHDTALAFAQDEEFHFVVLAESTFSGVSRLSVWRNGEPTVINGGVYVNLSQIDDVNNWLGRSNWTQDPNLNATYNEFRIYDGLLDAATIQANYAAGPGVVPSTPEPASGIAIISVEALPGQPLSFTFTSTAGRSYQVQTSTALLPEAAPAGGWQNEGGPITATASTTTFTDTAPPSGTKFYRVKELPPTP